MLRSLFWGDTGSFRLAFHLAEKEDSFEQVHLRPGIALDINIKTVSEGKRKVKKHCAFICLLLYTYIGYSLHAPDLMRKKCLREASKEVAH